MPLLHIFICVTISSRFIVRLPMQFVIILNKIFLHINTFDSLLTNHR